MPTPNLQPFNNPNETNPQSTIENALEALLPEQFQENRIQKARSLLGETSKKLTDEQIETIVVQIEYLLNCWLDSYERKLFNGRTLKETTK